MIYINVAPSIVFNGIVLSILGLVVERILIQGGLVRGDTVGVIVGCLLIGFIMALLDNERAYLLFWLGLGVFVPISIDRIDLFSSLAKGRWWWK